MAGGETKVDFGWSEFSDGSIMTEEESGYDDDDTPPSFDEREGTREILSGSDTELSFKLAHEREWARTQFEFGIDVNDKDRDSRLSVSEVDTDEPGAPLPAYDEFDVFATEIAERRLDPYAMFTGEHGAIDWEAGVRFETTEVDVQSDGESFTQDYNEVLPSAHLRWNLSDRDRLLFSVSRSVRRPNFNFLVPTLLEGEYGDNDFFGNPLLRPETANGIDLGFERRLGTQGIVGFNVFYRDVRDLIEIVNTGEPSDEAVSDYEDDVDDFIDDHPGADETTPGYPQFDPESFVYSVDNVGDGYVYGFEFDLSTPLSIVGLDNTGIFLNYSWLDSEVQDLIGERMFNDQAKYVGNIGFVQEMPDWNASFGASYRRQGDALARILAEEVSTQYGADLELFLEKLIGRNMSWRLTASNLLDASKDEVFNKFDTLGDQVDRNFDEYELETEKAGPVVQLIARYTF
jgi:outer membrane receptor protein involved in Fe transport